MIYPLKRTTNHRHKHQNHKNVLTIINNYANITLMYQLITYLNVSINYIMIIIFKDVLLVSEMVTSEETKTSNNKNNKDKEKKNPRSLVFSIVGIVLCVVLLPILILNIVLIIQSFSGDNSKIPNVGGTFPLMVKSGSMSPTIEEGDLIILHATDKKYDYKKNEIITFWEKGAGSVLITHRIIDVTKDDNGNVAYVTQGDFNATQDRNLVHAEDIVGVYQNKLPGLGRIALFMQTIPGIIICVVLPLAIFVVYDILRRRYISKKEQTETAALLAELESLKKEKSASDETKASKISEDMPKTDYLEVNSKEETKE